MNRKIIVTDKHGNILKEYKGKEQAIKGEKIALSTFTRNLNGKVKYPENGRFYSWGEKIEKTTKQEHNKKGIVELDLEGNFVRVYKTQKQVAQKKKISSGLVNHYLKGRAKPKGYRLVYKEEYDKTKPKQESEFYCVKEELVKPKTTEYYVNVLVGLANGTLVDGATYNMRGSKMVYNAETKTLSCDGLDIYNQQDMYLEVEVEMPLLLQEERNFLKNLLQAFSHVKGIRKCKSSKVGFEFIRIETGTDEDIILPDFKEGKYYGNLQIDKLYTVEDLDI